MIAHKRKHKRLVRRKLRGRNDVLRGSARPRLLVRRSLRHIRAQIVDDATGKTLAAVSTEQAAVRQALEKTDNVEAAKAVGKAIAEAALAVGVKEVAFDRGGRKYHGRVKALADTAREAGLRF